MRVIQISQRFKQINKKLNLENKNENSNEINFVDTKNKSNNKKTLEHHTYYLDKITKKYANKNNQATLQKIMFKNYFNKISLHK